MKSVRFWSLFLPNYRGSAPNIPCADFIELVPGCNGYVILADKLGRFPPTHLSEGRKVYEAGQCMARKISFTQTLDEATRVAALWQKLPDYRMGGVALNDFVDALSDSRALLEAYSRKKVELATLKEVRDQKIRDLSNLTSRFRRGMWSEFGSDSVEYAQAGGKRRSARKARLRRARSAS